jgi:hypothetical protein
LDRIKIADLAERQAKFYQIWTEIKTLSRAGKKTEAWDLYNTQLQKATLARRQIEDELAEIDKRRGDKLAVSLKQIVNQFTFHQIINTGS